MTLNPVFRLFIKDYDNITDEVVRNKYGILCSVLGIGLNVLLFIFKLIASVLTASIAIAADALNNLSDAGSSIITFIGFRLSGKPADDDHPFGHGRAEYICAVVVAMLILFMGYELCKSSIGKIITPQSTNIDTLSVIILCVAVLVKGCMFLFNRYVGTSIDSQPIIATAKDSLSDAVATIAVLIGLAVEAIFDINVDGYTGLLVSGFILYAGIGAIKDAMTPLLGTTPDRELVTAIKDTVMAHEEIVGIHDMIIHNYGPTRFMMSLHAEVPCDCDILRIHDTIDIIEREITAKFNCDAVIHMDPIETDNEQINEMSAKVRSVLDSIDSRLSMHDFRMVSGETHTNLIFDVVVPFDFHMTPKKLIAEIQKEIFKINNSYFVVITIDKSFV